MPLGFPTVTVMRRTAFGAGDDIVLLAEKVAANRALLTFIKEHNLFTLSYVIALLYRKKAFLATGFDKVNKILTTRCQGLKTVCFR